ncbi:MAG: thioredoxin family protein [Chitinophagaceae bacterium]|nr:thioredoxin family protein [Chitinophagaceae bacterium]
MKKIIFSTVLLLATTILSAQEKPTVYNPAADAKKEIATAVAKAKAENKNVFLQIGGNWCIWCLYFNNLTTQDAELKSYMEQNYNVVHVNYSEENKNLDVLASLDYPQRFGFPVFVILDQNGKRIHTQNSEYLEEGKGHSKKKVMQFLQQWSPSALDPSKYTN